MSDCPQFIRLTSEQVKSIARAATLGAGDDVVVMLPEPLTSRRLPGRAVWEQRIRELGEEDFSLSLAHGLLLLELLAGGRVASVEELAEELGTAAVITGRYLRTLVLAGLVERELGTSGFRLMARGDG